MKLVLKPGTVLDTTASNIDTGFTAELVVDLTKVGYPHGLGDHIVFFTVDYYDGDSFVPFTDSYGTRTWWGGEYDNTCCPPWAYMDPFEHVLADVPGHGPGASGFALLNPAPNPFRTATTLHYRLGARSKVALEVFDPQGRVVHTHDYGVQDAGEQNAFVLGFNGRAGLYLYRLRMTDPGTGGEQAAFAGRLVVVR